MKVPLADQIAAMELLQTWLKEQFTFAQPPNDMDAAIATLKLVQKYETEIRACIEACRAKEDPAVALVLGVFPEAEVTIVTREVKNG